ncbi:hypothetical protein LINGRAHAP2_LOCUS15387 [Linum grandiflorum]
MDFFFLSFPLLLSVNGWLLGRGISTIPLWFYAPGGRESSRSSCPMQGH